MGQTTIDYTAAAETYDNTRAHSDQVIDRLAAAVPLGPSAAVLDFGCGTGNYQARIAERYGCRCCGVEPSEGMRRRALAKPGGLEVLPGDHRAIPFPDASFELCYMTDVIHHVPDLAQLFGELRRVIRPAGLLCIVTESHAQIDARFYNRYFPSLAASEKRRYPDLGPIAASARSAGWTEAGAEVIPAPARAVTDAFIRNAAEKNWSMFRLLSEVEFEAGLRALAADRGRAFEAAGAGQTLLWLRPGPAGEA